MSELADGKVARQIGQRGFYARVFVRVMEARDVQVTLSARYGEKEWLDAAVVGVRAGLAVASSSACIEVVEIHGMAVDTNPTVMAIAGVLSVWNAISFTPPPELASRLYDLVPHSKEFGPDELEEKIRC